MTTVSIQFPEGDVETILGSPTETPQCFELRGHSFLLPLGPGDVVRVDEQGWAVEVVSLAPQWIYMVDLHLPADYLAGPLGDDHPATRAVEKLVLEWSGATTVTMMHGFAMLVSSTSAKWFAEQVRASKYVEHCKELRNPQHSSVALPDNSTQRD